MDDFLLRALVAGLGVAVVAGPLGCFLVWRRMAYFGATLAHSAMLGIALGLLLGLNVNLGILVVCLAVAALLVAFQGRPEFASDTLLGILAHGSLALGLVALAFLEGQRIDLLAYLFGDILAVNRRDLLWLAGVGAAILGALIWLWRPLLLITVQEDLARVEGLPVQALRLGFMLLIALMVAVAMKIVGLLLIVSLLIIPAATARPLAKTPEHMALLASLFGAVAAAGGLGASMAWDTPAGPSIVTVSVLIFTVTAVLTARRSSAS